MINKKGNLYSIIAIMGTVLLVLCVVFMFVLGGAVFKDAMGTVFTEVRSMGNITDGVNVTTLANHVFNPVESIMNNFSMYASILYVLGIVLVFTLAFTFRNNLNGIGIALFVVAALLIIVFCIILSNTYEEFYMDPSFIGTALHDSSMISYLILYSPMIMTIVIFVAGIIMMTGKEGGAY